LASQPNVPDELLPGIAANLDQIGKTELALETARRAAGKQPYHDAIWFLISRLMIKLDCHHIIVTLRRAFELAPDNLFYRVDLAVYLSQSEQTLEAYRLLTAVSLASLLTIHCPPRLLSMAVLFHSVGDDFRATACHSRLTNTIHF
jgi:hypothetical protein